MSDTYLRPGSPSDEFLRMFGPPSDDERIDAAARRLLRTRAEEVALRGVILESIPQDVRDLADRLGVPALAEVVWCAGFQAGFKLASAYANLKSSV